MQSLYDTFTTETASLHARTAETGQVWQRVGGASVSDLTTVEDGAVKTYDSSLSNQTVTGSTYYLNSLASTYDMDAVLVATAYRELNTTFGTYYNPRNVNPILKWHMTANGQNYYYALINPLLQNVYLGVVVGGVDTILAFASVPGMTNLFFYTLHAQTRGTLKEVYVNGALLLSYNEAASAITTPGYAGFGFTTGWNLGLSSGTPSVEIASAFACVFDPSEFGVSGFVAGSFSSSTGKVTASGALASGGVPPYTYIWSRFALPGLTPTDLVQTTSALDDSGPFAQGVTYRYTQTIRDVAGNAETAGTFDVAIPLFLQYRKTLTARARIVASPLGSDGVQTLDTSFSDLPTGVGDILCHPDGNLYAVYPAQVPGASGPQLNLYFRKSTDGGVSWSEAERITTGGWDNQAAICLLDEDDPESDIAVVFTRAQNWRNTASGVQTPYLYRMVIDRNGDLIGGIDPLFETSVFPNLWSLSVLQRAGGGYMITACAIAGNETSIYLFENDTFTTNLWTNRSITLNALAAAPNVPLVGWVRTRKLANGHLAMIFTAGGPTGASSAYGAAYPSQDVRRDAYLWFSDDDGVTWGTPRKLTNYSTAVTAVNQPEIRTAETVDIFQKSDGKIGIVVQEGSLQTRIGRTTTPSLNIPTGGSTSAIYSMARHDGKNLLLIGSSNGCYVLNLTTGALSRLGTDTTPAIWNNKIRCIAVSPDNRWLALGTENGLEILDTTSSTVSAWPLISLRTTTSPALRHQYVSNVIFTDDNTLYAFYGGNGSGSTGKVGVVIDLTLSQGDPGFLSDFTVSQGLTRIGANNVFRRTETVGATTYDALYAAHSGFLYRFGLNGDTPDGQTLLSATTDPILILPETVNDDKIVWSVATNTVMNTVRIRGLIMTVSVYAASALGFQSTVDNILPVPGMGALIAIGDSFGVGYSLQHYAAGDLAINAVSLGSKDNFPGIYPPDGHWNLALPTADGEWMIVPDGPTSTITFFPLMQSGKISFTYQPYDENALDIAPTGEINFFPLLNPTKIGTDALHIYHPRLTRDANDNLFFVARRTRNTRASAPFAPVVGRVDTDAYRVTARARIVAVTTPTVQARTRIAGPLTKTVSARAAIVFAQCVYARARIVPRATVTVQARAAIRATRVTTVRATYAVSAQRETTVRGTYLIATGHSQSQTLTARACISVERTAVVRGQYLVRRDLSAIQKWGITVNRAGLQTVQARARIETAATVD